MVAIGFGEPADSPYPTCDVIRFSPGSVIADYQIMMPPKSEFTEEEMADTIQDAIINGTVGGVTVKNQSLVVTRKYLEWSEKHFCLISQVMKTMQSFGTFGGICFSIRRLCPHPHPTHTHTRKNK